MSSRRLRAALVVCMACLALAGCSHQKSQPVIEYMPDMAYGPTVHAQHEDLDTPGVTAMRLPVQGTVPRGFTPYRFQAQDSLLAQAELFNPLPRTADVLGRGQRAYMTYCVVCHGEKGDGQGYIVPKFPMPPPLFSDKVINWPDGRIYHVITRGQNLMPSYASQILPEDRWAVIHFVRVLQRSARPTAQDLAAAGIKVDSTKTASGGDSTLAAPGAAPAGGRP